MLVMSSRRDEKTLLVQKGSEAQTRNSSCVTSFVGLHDVGDSYESSTDG